MTKFKSILKDIITTKAYAARTFTADPLQAFRFRVAISGIDSSIGFQKVGGMSREIEVATYLENMFEHEHKLPGRETFSEITFERGMYQDAALENAYKEIFTNSATRRDCTLNVVDRFGSIRRTFSFYECWFSKFEVADLDATSSDVLIETLTMVFENMG